MCKMNHLEQVWDDIENASDEQWDDYHEWAPEVFAFRFEVSADHGMLLWQAVQARTNNNRNAYSCDPTKLGQTIQESLHQSLDGWTIEQGLIIQAYLSDIAYAVSQGGP